VAAIIKPAATTPKILVVGAALVVVVEVELAAAAAPLLLTTEETTAELAVREEETEEETTTEAAAEEAAADVDATAVATVPLVASATAYTIYKYLQQFHKSFQLTQGAVTQTQNGLPLSRLSQSYKKTLRTL
jgi:hypothetical protein